MVNSELYVPIEKTQNCIFVKIVAVVSQWVLFSSELFPAMVLQSLII